RCRRCSAHHEGGAHPELAVIGDGAPERVSPAGELQGELTALPRRHDPDARDMPRAHALQPQIVRILADVRQLAHRRARFPGNSPTWRPAAREPIRKAVPAAVWSVPPDPFSFARRPNSDHTSVRTRSATPRASRSRWNA